ncbi:AAA-ATPase At2g18193-like [Macadamia integrifolia]|uniref:AAA-ATPase At2g18193-like n=1 Tax=Macadamia integrifolia TaxID=60698 RepID=UPI001C527248|nr:AAA-ATPase At2g18193-like [Macadamia integrifolia]
MFDFTTIPSTSKVLSVYASLVTSIMIFRTMANQLIPHQIQDYIFSRLQYILAYLIFPTAAHDHRWFEKDQEIIDFFQGIQLKWKLFRYETQRRCVVFLPATRSGGIKGVDRRKESCETINLEHPATFDKLAMDPELKRALIDDLDRFVKRKEFYKRVGKAWKRGYLLYGPPGTGKSSLIAAMANHLRFDIYDIELTGLRNNSGLKDLLVWTTNRSIIVIEDIDCSIEMNDRGQKEGRSSDDYQVSFLRS